MNSPKVHGEDEALDRTDEFAEKIRVLLIDDDEDTYVITRSQLADVESANIELDWASSFEAGLEAMRHGGHDAYLVDYRLGARDGLELMRQAKAEGCLAPVIILTGEGDHTIDVRAMKEGAADYMVKGQITGRFIERSLRYAIARRRAEDERLHHAAQLRILTEQMPAVLWTTDRHLRFTSSSGAVLQGLNLQPNELVGRTLCQCLNTSLEDHPAAIAHRKALRGESVSFEIDWMDRTYHAHVSPLRRDADRIVGAVGVALDVTHERNAQEEMRAARRVQEAFLPKSVPQVPGWDLAGVCRPAAAAGGDYFDYIKMADGSLGIVIADVSRHDFGSAMIMADTCRLVRMLAERHTDLGEILTAANRALAGDTSSDYFVTLFMARLDIKTRSLTYAAAGHDGYVLNPSGTVQHLQSTSVPLGVDEATVIPCAESIALVPGQWLVLLTDGFPDAMAPDGKAFGSARVLEFMHHNRSRSARDILDGLYGAIQDYCRPNSHHDDATAVILKVEAESSPAST